MQGTTDIGVGSTYGSAGGANISDPNNVMNGMGANGSNATQPDMMSAFAGGNTGAAGNPNYASANLIPGGYLDLAAPLTQFRLRYDNAIENRFPDRGEYFYAQCGCFRDLLGDQNAKGPSGANVTSVSYQAVRSYLELAFSESFSVFAELPVQWVDFHTFGPSPGSTAPTTTGGIGDIDVGFKYALLAEPDEYFTFQLRTYVPTGDSFGGLGTNHVSIEPALLYYNRFNQHWIGQAEFKSFNPISVTGYASNVLQLGAGLGYVLYQGERFTVTPMFEAVAWTFLGGKKLDLAKGAVEAGGDTICNIKPGIRIGLSDLDAPMGQQRHSLYFGWGHAVTGQQLYSDIYRVEYRIIF